MTIKLHVDLKLPHSLLQLLHIHDRKEFTLALNPMNNGSSIVARLLLDFRSNTTIPPRIPFSGKKNAVSSFSSVAFPATPGAARQKPPLYCPPRQELGTSSKSALNPPTLSVLARMEWRNRRSERIAKLLGLMRLRLEAGKFPARRRSAQERRARRAYTRADKTVSE
jgi:hypothetical protein